MTKEKEIVLDPFKLMDIALKANEFQGIPSNIRARYIRLLVTRATRFYLESNLDAYVIDEDLADGESDTGFYESGHPLRKTDLCNLVYSEQKEIEYQEDLGKYL